MRDQHCTHTPLPVDSSLDSGRMVTEYQARFFVHSSPAVKKLRKPPEIWKEGRVTNMPAFRSDVKRRVPKVTTAHQVPPEGSMKHTSTYVHDYKAYSIQRNTVTKTAEYNPPSAKMDVRSSYKEEFRSWDAPLQRSVRTNCNLKLSHKFDKTIPFQEHSRPKATNTAGKSWKVTPAGEKALPFESATSYKLHYICHPPQPKWPTQQLVYKPSVSPLSCVTTYRHDYRCLQVDVAKPIRSTWEGIPTTNQGCAKLWDKCKTWPLRLTCGRREVVDSSPKDGVESIPTTHTDFVVQQCQAMAGTNTPKQDGTMEKVSLEAISTTGEKHRYWEAKKVLPITQVKEPNKLEGLSKNTTACPCWNMPKTSALPHSFQPNHRSVPGDAASTARDVIKEIQPCSENGGRAARADGNRPQRTTSARERGTAHADKTHSNKPKCSHSPKTTLTVQSAVLTRVKKSI
ncbi:uncharacterized protein LOC133135271 [Conger conger]|uniref:uncharacterized protein LOC133135271 n=1 Tax=Conger conger TaxID=82655 RepID=UPI002A59B99F|nr:uncharacterized protein LOC133135271 [Conger conger]